MSFNQSRSRLLASTGLAASLVMIPAVSFSADSYFSRVTYGDKTVSAENARLAGDLVALQGAGATSTTALFDISVSIEENPAGDNDSSTDGGATDAEQQAYETIFKHFADAVCEQTNGIHKLRKISVFKQGRQSGNADIVWGKSGRPGAHTTGFGKPGWQIFMFDNFGSIKVSDGGDDLTRLGYITGHEWGHYALGVYDEYVEAGRTTGVRPSQPLAGDTAVDQSIMHSERTAVSSGDFEWLNHSTANNIGNVANTAQGRVYGKSGWDTLIQTTNNDPTTINNWAKPERTHYSNLVGNQPTAADNWFKLQMPAGQADCRNQLDIQWVDDLELDIVLDRSGSMGGSPIANAKSAATALIDLLPEGQTAAGVSSFSSTVSSDAPITAIAGDSERATLKAAVNGLSASGLTAMWDGAVFGLNKLINYRSANSTTAQQLVFLLSDGADNSSSEDLASTTAAFNNVGVPVIAFGYGSGVDPNLTTLATNTGGRYFQSPTTVTDIQNAFTQAFADASGSSTLASASLSAAAGSVEDQDFIIDDTISEVSILFTYSGGASDYNLSLLDGSGTDTGQTFDCNAAGGAVSCVLDLDAAAVTALGTGTYTVRAENTTGSDIVHSLNVISSTVAGATGGGITIKVASQEGPSVAYPEPIVISTVVSQELPITGLAVSASVTGPSGTPATIDMNDDGIGADQYANDGLYSAWVPYDANGTYDVQVTVANTGGAAQYATDALTQAHMFAGAMVEPGDTVPNPTLAAQNFQRLGKTQIAVSGVMADDHVDDPAFPVACTALTPDNTAIAGKIDAAGDADCFVIPGPIATTDPLTIRTFNNSLMADPKYTIYGNDGTTEIATADPATATPSDGALYTTVAAADIDDAGMVILVSDSDPTHVGGTYSVSAGPALPSDKPSGSAPTPPTTPGGGAMGPIGLGFLALLSMLGLATRRRRPNA